MGRKYKNINYQPFQGFGGVLLSPNQTLRAGQFIRSTNGQFFLQLREDGNLVLEEGASLVWVADERQPYSLTIYRIPSHI